MKDFNVDYEILRRKIISIIEEEFQKYGFEPILTPIVEYWETLKGKYGEEAENMLIWRFKLPFSEKEYALKYDNTVPLARFYAKYRPPLPFKRYTIDRVFRYDEPQKGRYREFWQADADIIGSPYPEADAEIIELFDRIFKKLGFKNFYIYINDRELIENLFKFFKVSFKDVYTIIDKLDKIGIEGVKKELSKKFNENLVEKIINIISLKGQEAIDEISKIDKEEIKERINVLNKIIEMSGSKNLLYNPALVRGLEYYTGMVFEIVTEEFQISLAGGGRYDNLIGLFTKSQVPAVGGSLGINRILDIGIENKIFDINKKTIIDVAVIYIKQDLYEEALKIARKLRDLGLRAYIDVSRKKFKNQVEYVVTKNIRYLVIIGEKEIKEKRITVQDRSEKRKYTLNIEEINKITEIIHS
ncbi:MAG: histidine--tRNA ligase [Nanopusillaceae archaeon]